MKRGNVNDTKVSTMTTNLNGFVVKKRRLPNSDLEGRLNTRSKTKSHTKENFSWVRLDF